MRTAPGFSLVEALVAVIILTVLAGALFGLLIPDVRLAQAGPAAADLQQRARVALMAIVTDLRRAGVGAAAGPHAGSLTRLTTAVWPRRIGPGSPDGPLVARDDAISVMATAPGGHGTLAAPLGFTGTLAVAPGSPCPLSSAFCGFSSGDLVLVADGDGEADVFVVTAAAGPQDGTVSDWISGRSRTYPVGSLVSGADVRSFFFDAGASQLRQTIQDSSSLPAVDDVVALEFRYFGDPTPPRRPQPPLGVANCLFDAAGVPAPLAVLPGDPAGLVELPLSLFADGPWCGTGPLGFDADLLRVRQVRVTLRLQATAPHLQAGRGRQSLSNVAEAIVAFAVAPPALGRSR